MLATQVEAASPYPSSKRITAIHWDLGSYQWGGDEGDIWPVTWLADGRLLGAWGDGKVVCPVRASYGVAAIGSSLPGTEMTSVFCGPGPMNLGKMMALIAAPDALYARVNLQDGSAGYPIWKSTDGGSTWTKPASPLLFFLDTFLQYGRGNAGAPGDYVYGLDPWETEIRLVRVRADSVQSSDAYEYFSGTAYAPAWRLGSKGSKPIFVDLAGTVRPIITYDPGLRRYLLTVAHAKRDTTEVAHKVGIFEAPNPWGPWRTISYVDNFLGMTGGSFFGVNFPVKWQTDSGATLWASFSCYNTAGSPCGQYHDRFNLIRATLDVAPEPPPPVTAPDTASTNANTPVTIAVTGNDVGTGLKVRSLTVPTNGTVRINTDGTVTYTPKTGYTGSDAFGYLVSDTVEQTASGEVAVTVLNRPPVAAADSATTIAPASVRIYVLTNDRDPDGHALKIAGATTPPHGGVSISTDRKSILYKPAAGFSGADGFGYTVDDGHNGFGQGVVTVAVTNRPPVAAPDSAAIAYNTAQRIYVLANDSDPDGQRLSITTTSAPARGTVSISSDRRSLVYKPASGYRGSDSFPYTISDGYGGTAKALVSVTVGAS
ncbi:MAG: Ig-like domain-containing protein [Geminicoccaceae bacterium]